MTEVPLYSREELLEISGLAQKESNIQLLNWMLQLLGTGMTHGMIRQQVNKKILEVKGESNG